LRSDVPKPIVEINGKPICAHAIEAFERSAVIDSIVVVGHKDQLSQIRDIVDRYRFRKVIKVVTGGATRRESVANGIAALDGDTDVVVVHDGARPLVSAKVIEDAVRLCAQWDAVVTAVPVKPTIKRVTGGDMCVTQTLNRDELWEAQTPQVFKKDILAKAHAQYPHANPSDDAVMVEALGVKVRIVQGDYANIKITTREDLAAAESLRKEVSC